MDLQSRSEWRASQRRTYCRDERKGQQTHTCICRLKRKSFHAIPFPQSQAAVTGQHNRPLAHSLARSLARSLAHSLAHSLTSADTDSSSLLALAHLSLPSPSMLVCVAIAATTAPKGEPASQPLPSGRLLAAGSKLQSTRGRTSFVQKHLYRLAAACRESRLPCYLCTAATAFLVANCT